jgi:hypothetical protein
MDMRWYAVVLGVLLAGGACAGTFPFRIAIAHGVRNARQGYDGDVCDQYDVHFRDAGWPLPARFASTKEGMDRLAAELPNLDVVIFSSLFNYGGRPVDMKPYAAAFRAYLERGGAMFVTDAMYGGDTDWLKDIDPGIALASEGGCKSPYKELEPRHPLRAFPNVPGNDVHWGHLLLAGDKWETVAGCCGGRKACAALARVGKGLVYASSSAHGGHWGTNREFENFLAFLQTGNPVALDTSKAPLIPDFMPGKAQVYGLPGVSNRTDKTVRVAFDYTVATAGGTRGYRAGAEVPPHGTATDIRLPCDLPLRGAATVSCVIELDGKAIVPRVKKIELPQLFTLYPPKFRGYVRAGAGEPFSVGVEVVPYDEDIRLLVCRLNVAGQVAHQKVEGRFSRVRLNAPALRAGDRPVVKGTLLSLGRTLATAEAPVEAVEERPDAMGIRDDLCFVTGGKPFFPLGIYHVKPADYAAARALGLNMVQAFSWEGETNVMRAAAASGLKVVIEMHGQFGAAALREYMVARYKDWPALGFWYVQDEPGLDMAEPSAKYAAYRDTDTQHPAWLVSCIPEMFPLHQRACDILAFDRYPLSREEISEPVDCISAEMDAARAATRGEKPVVAILQCFGGEPENLMVNMAYQAVVHGASGIFWYPWDEGGGKGAKYDAKTQAILRRICGELNGLAPMLANRASHRLARLGKAAALYGEEPDGTRHLLMVNPSPETAAVADGSLPGGFSLQAFTLAPYETKALKLPAKR